MADHLEEGHFYCGECLLSFTCPFLVPIHFQLEHEFRCVCDQRFSDKFKLLTHMENVGCCFPFTVEVSTPTATQLSKTEKKSKLTVPRSSLASGVFDAASSCIRKTADGFLCSVCEKISMRRYRLWQHVKKSHSDVLKKMTSLHLKTVIQKYCAMVGEVLACILCGKPYLKQWNIYEHFCVEHTLQISQITVDFAEVKEQDLEPTSTITVLCNRLYAKVREGKYRCLICRRCWPSLRAVAFHLRKHGKILKEYFDKMVMGGGKLGRRKKICIGSSRNHFSDKFNVENARLKTKCDSSGLNQKSPSSLRSEAVVKRPEQELEFLRGYIVKKETFYYCQLCPTKSRRKRYLYQHLAIRHDDILGETLSTFKQNEASVFERKDTSGSIFTPEAQYGGTGTPSLDNVVGNVEFHTDIWSPENNRSKTTGSMLFNKSGEQESLSVTDTSFQRLTVSQDSYVEHAVRAGDHGHVKLENAEKRSSSFVHNFPDAGPPDGKRTPLKRGPILQPAYSDGVLASAEAYASDGQPGDAVGNSLGLTVSKKPRLLLSESPPFSCSGKKIVSEATSAFCMKTGAYVCSICNHKLASKSGWYKHFKQCRVGNICGRKKRPSFASKHSESDDLTRLSESALVDSQIVSAPSAVPETSNVKKKGGNGQKLWRCVTCQCQFISHSRWQRHFVSCKRKSSTVRKQRRSTTAENEFLRKNCRQKDQKFSCRICGLDYRRIHDAFYHIRRKHVTAGIAGADDTNLKLKPVNATIDRSPARVKSRVKTGEGRNSGNKIGAISPRRKSTVADAVLNRRAYVQSQIREENGCAFCKICGRRFLLRCYARQHVNRLHLGLKISKRPPATRISPVSHNVASTKVNGLRAKVMYKPRNKNLTNGTKAFMKGAKLKTEVGNGALVKSCGLCSKRFLSLHSLSAHVASEHMTIETTPYPCVMCPRNFERRQYCVRHFVHTHCVSVKSKQVVKRFRCKICNILFPNRTCRIQHLSEVHADVCEVCSFCNAMFLTRQDLQKHIRAVHLANISNASEGDISNDVSQNQGSSKDCTDQIA